MRFTAPEEDRPCDAEAPNKSNAVIVIVADAENLNVRRIRFPLGTFW